MENFLFSMPTKIYFGKGQISSLPKALKRAGANRILMVYGQGSIQKNGIYDHVVNELKKGNYPYYELSGIEPNPRMNKVREGVSICREHELDFILAVGGGSVIDTAKAISAGVYYDGDPWDFFSRKQGISKAMRLGVVLTLSATGSEMNGNAVIKNLETQEKHAVGSAILKPQFSICDPEYTYSVNAYHTAAGTVDMMSHVFEQYFSPVLNTYLVDRMSEAILKTCVHYCPIAMVQPNNYEARTNLMWAGTWALNGFLSLGKISDFATHQIEHEISAKYDITHGAGLSALTPSWMRYVLDEETLPRFKALAEHVWGVRDDENDYELAIQGISALDAFLKSVGMPVTLSQLNVGTERFEEMAQDIVRFGPIGNVKRLDEKDVLAVLRGSA
ncbi:iron-containing alcohol dehydrogenase [Thermoproteota archaeon]